MHVNEPCDNLTGAGLTLSGWWPWKESQSPRAHVLSMSRKLQSRICWSKCVPRLWLPMLGLQNVCHLGPAQLRTKKYGGAKMGMTGHLSIY